MKCKDMDLHFVPPELGFVPLGLDFVPENLDFVPGDLVFLVALAPIRHASPARPAA